MLPLRSEIFGEAISIFFFFYFHILFKKQKQLSFLELFQDYVISHWRKPGNELATFAIKYIEKSCTKFLLTYIKLKFGVRLYREKLHQTFKMKHQTGIACKIIQKKTT